MKRRQFLGGLAAGSALSVVDWLDWFRRFGVPGSSKELGIAEAAAQSLNEPHFLIYWFVEGGWDGYSMFNPVDTRNDATMVIPAGELHPNPEWSAQYYRPRSYGQAPNMPPNTQGNITYGFLAQQGLPLFNDLAVVASHHGNAFHSGGRWDYHYGSYNHSLSNPRGADERTVMQAFCEAYGQSYLMPHISWHRWLSDGELSIANYPDGTGYYERLGPSWAHTIYGRTPREMRDRLSQIGALTSNLRDARVRRFVDDLHDNFLRDKNGPSIRAFQSAVQIHRSLVGGGSGQVTVNPATMFTDPQLRADFGVRAEDETTSATEVNGNPARSKNTPNTNVQALMTYELMTKGLSIGFFLESRDIRGFDTHQSRRGTFNNQGQPNQLNDMNRHLWTPLKVLVDKLKTTEYGSSGRPYWDFTNIVLCSEMGRTINGNVDSILSSPDSDQVKYEAIMDQDICQHWPVSSVAFLGGNVQGNRQWGRVGSVSEDAIPLLPDGSLDPAFDPVTGQLRAGQQPSAQGFVSGAGHVYATALHLSGLDPAQLRSQGKGRNQSPPMTFIKR